VNSQSGVGSVLDASAVLALLFQESGAEIVRTHLSVGAIGAVSLAEVLAKLSDHGLPWPDAVEAMAILGLEVIALSETQAQLSAKMRPMTRAAGLSLGDRACFALAAELGATAVTADRNWAQIAEATGVIVQIIR